MAAYIRTPKKGSDGRRSVQVVWNRRGGKTTMTQVGVAHTDEDLAVLRLQAEEVMRAGRQELDLGLDESEPVLAPQPPGRRLRSTGSQAEHLWLSLDAAYTALGLGEAAGDDVFRDLVLARVIEPTSKAQAIRVCANVGFPTRSYKTIMRRLPLYSAEGFREKLAAACAASARLGPKSLVLYDCSTLHFEIDEPDEFRIPGFSKERRLEPQIVIGLLTDATGAPLMVNAFEGNTAETHTMIPTIRKFLNTHGLTDVVIVADAGMVSDTNKKQIEAEGLRFIIGAKMPFVPYQVEAWHKKNPNETPPDGLVLTQVGSGRPTNDHDRQTIFYQYRHARARRSLKGIDTQVAKAERMARGKAKVKSNKYLSLTGESREVNRELENRHRMLAGWKAYVTNIPDPKADFVIGSYHNLWRIEKAFRMKKGDLAARPIYHQERDSIEAHLTIVFAAMVVSHWIETVTGMSIKKFVNTARPVRTTYAQVGSFEIPVDDDIPPELAAALAAIKRKTAHPA